MINNIQRDTRRFAKRQRTWWRNQPNTLGWIPVTELVNDSDEHGGFIRETSFGNILNRISRISIEFVALAEKSIASKFMEDLAAISGVVDQDKVFYEKLALADYK